LEKIETYLNRKKIRDLYDIYFLLNYVENRGAVEKELRNFVNRYSPPVDEANLVNIVIVGAVPTADELLGEIKKWAK